MDDRDVRELLPWYANGTLSPDQQRAVEEALARSPALQAELAAWHAVRENEQRSVTLPSGDLGWSALLARIEGEAAGQVVPLRPRPTPRWMKPALALAASLVLAQAAVIGVLLVQRETTLTPAGGPQAPGGVLLQVTFKPGATEQQIRALLATVDAEIAGGPGALGVYTLRVPAGSGESARARLARATDLVESVSVVRP